MGVSDEGKTRHNIGCPDDSHKIHSDVNIKWTGNLVNSHMMLSASWNICIHRSPLDSEHSFQ